MYFTSLRVLPFKPSREQVYAGLGRNGEHYQAVN